MDTSKMPVENLKRSFRRLVALWLLTALLASLAWRWYATTPPPVRHPLMEFVSDQHAATSAVCPGDTIPYTINLSVNEPGVYAIDVSVWRITPPATVIFSEGRRFVATEATSYTLERQWVVPPTHLDPVANGQVPWEPGQYERRHAITTVSRETMPSFAVVPFSIRGDCPQ